MAFTKAQIDKFKFQGTSDDAYDIRWDTSLTGFGVRVRPTGRKTFVLRYQDPSGKRKVAVLGDYGVLSLDEAKRLAREKIRAIEHGDIPFLSKKKGITWAELAPKYLELHSSQKKSGWQDKLRIRTRILPFMAKKEVDKTTMEDVLKLRIQIKEGEKDAEGKVLKKGSIYEANRTKALVSAMYNWALKAKLVPFSQNPAEGIKDFPEKKRKRPVQASEMPKIWGAIEAEVDPYARAALKLLLFTGRRPGEFLTLRWEDVDLETGAYTIRSSKRGEEVPIHGFFADEGLAILKTLQRYPGNPYVFVGYEDPLKKVRGTDHLKDLDGPWDRVRKATGLKDLRLYDLRHTFGSWLADANFSGVIIGRSMHHTNPRTTERYMHVQDAPMKGAVTAMEQLVTRAAKAKK